MPYSSSGRPTPTQTNKNLMANDRISLVEVFKKREELLLSGVPLADAFRSFLSWLGEHEKDLDSAASEYFDKVLENAYQLARENVAKMPDSIDARQAKRTIARGLNGHISTNGILSALEHRHSHHSKIIDDWSEALSFSHQSIADFLYDLTQNKESFQYSIVLVTLLYGCIDELTVAHYLGRHFYFVQANAHLRTVLETMEKIELFVEQPEWIEVWANGDWKTIERELGPAAVRQKLGRNRYDALYGYLSNNGVHASFDSFRNRAFLDSKKERTARVFVGGTPFVHLQIFHFQFSLVVSNLLLSRLVRLLSKALNFEEAEQILKTTAKKFEDFNNTHLVPWAIENQLDTSEMQQLFENLRPQQ